MDSTVGEIAELVEDIEGYKSKHSVVGGGNLVVAEVSVHFVEPEGSFLLHLLSFISMEQIPHNLTKIFIFSNP